MPISSNITASVRASLAIQFILTAANFTRKIKEIETEHEGEPFGDFFDDISSYTLSTILNSSTALEGYINEIFVDRATYFPEYNQQLMDDVWSITERGKILEKYGFALSLKDKGRFKKGTSFYQDAEDLIKLRNTLVHFKPEWSHEQGEHKKLMKRLKNKFELSPFFQNAESAFPNSIMGYSCAKWSVTTTLNFIEEFSVLADIPNKMKKFQNRLSL